VSIDIRGNSDKIIKTIATALENYQRDHPDAQIDLYRQNVVSVRVRIIDRSIAKKSKAERNDLAWSYLSDLSDDVQSDISMLLVLTPDEAQKSFANLEFEDPHPSRL
jgi:hypothetical protein